MAQLLFGRDKFLKLTTIGISIAYATVFLLCGDFEPVHLFFSIILGSALVALSVIDLAIHRLPNVMTIALLVLGLMCTATLDLQPGVLIRALAAAVAYSLLWTIAEMYYRLRGRAGLGLGDAKLFAGAATWVGPLGLANVLLLAAVAALATALLLISLGRMSVHTRLAFGPFLAGALWLVWLSGPMGT